MGAGVQVLINESDYEQTYNLIQPDGNTHSEISCPFYNSKNIRFGLGSNKKTPDHPNCAFFNNGYPFW